MFGGKTRVLKAAAVAAAGAVLQPAFAAEIFASKYDTFISQALEQKDFSREKYVRVSNAEAAKAIAYLPFYLDPNEIGFQADRDKIMLAQLVLRYKKDAGEKNGGAENLKKIPRQELKCEFKIYALIDGETFLPNAENSRVSWNGKNASTAPKHNNIDDELADDGLLELGTITIDFAANPPDEGGEIEFSSDKLAEFLNFAYGASKAQGDHLSFRPQVEKIERICLIIKQTAGAVGLAFHSADSAADGSDNKPGKPKGAPDDDSPHAELPDSNGDNGQPDDLRPKINFEFRSTL